MTKPILIPATRYVRLPVFEAMTGYSTKAVRRKIEEGVWLEGRQYRKAPDGHILIDLHGYETWVEGQRQTA
jgi:hypothetical protein